MLKGDLNGELTVEFLKIVTAEVSKHCCFMVSLMLLLLGRATESARIKGFEAWYPKLKGKFTLPLCPLVIGPDATLRLLSPAFLAVPALAKPLVSHYINYVVWHHFWMPTLGLLMFVIFQECWASLCLFCLWNIKVVKSDLHENPAQAKYCPDWSVMGTFCSLCFRLQNNADFSLQAIRRINIVFEG